VDITFFGRSAEVANQYIHKGSKILVEGKLVFEQWTDQNGQKRSKHGVTVDVMQMLDSKSNTPSSEPMQNTQQEPNTYVPKQAPAQTYNNSPQTHQNNSSTNVDEKIMSEIDNMEEPFPF